MSMEKLNDTKLKELQKKYGFKFGRVKGTNIINIIKHENPRFEIIDFDEFIKKKTPKTSNYNYNFPPWLENSMDFFKCSFFIFYVLNSSSRINLVNNITLYWEILHICY